LDHKHFNTPLRRDILAKVNHYFNVLNQLKTHKAKSLGDVSGSGKKPVPQKGRGASR
jgi:large subunit ribosomal protein L4